MNHYYSFIEEQANKQAETMTAEYLKKVKGGDNQPNEQGLQPEESNEKVFIVYKIMQTPLEALQAGM